MSRYPTIVLPDQGEPAARSPPVAVFVGGPLDGVRREQRDFPEWILIDDAHYRRSVRCADDVALRYVFEE